MKEVDYNDLVIFISRKTKKYEKKKYRNHGSLLLNSEYLLDDDNITLLLKYKL